jgi:hypothetical protein
LQALQEDIKTVKCNLNIMLGASNSQDMMRIRVHLDEISMVSSSSARNQADMEEKLQTSLVRHRDDLAESLAHIYQQVDQRIGNVEELLNKQTAQFQASQYNQLGTSYGRRPSYSKSTIVSRQPTQYKEVESSGDISMRVIKYAACAPGCLCRCHIQTRTSLPGLVDRIFGQIFVGYAGLPLVNAKYDTHTCEKNQAAYILVSNIGFPLALSGPRFCVYS